MATVRPEHGVSGFYDGLLSGICIDVDAGTVMIARHDSYDCRYYICNVLHKDRRSRILTLSSMSR